MENCLKLQLKSSVNNSALEYLDGLRLYGVNGASTKNADFSLGEGHFFHAKVLSGTSPLRDGATEIDFEQRLSIGGGDYVLLITECSNMDAIMLYGSAAINLSKSLPNLPLNSLKNLIVNTAALLDDNLNLSKLTGTSLEILRLGKVNATYGTIESFGVCKNLQELSSASTRVTGSINTLAGLLYPTRDIQNYPNLKIQISGTTPSITYFDGENVHACDNSAYYVVFKSGGYEIRYGTSDGTLLYDSLA